MALREEKKEKCNIIVLGESAVGKTAFIKRFNEDKFEKSYLTTLGLDFITKEIKSKEGKIINMKIFDTAGQERFRTLTNNYYQKADGILLIYSIKDKDSFSTINNWINEIKTKAKDDVVVFLIGNKCDLDKEREVSKKEGQTLGEKYKIPFYESSAKLDVNVKNVFEDLAQMVVEKSGNVVEEEGEELTKKKNNIKKKKCC